MNRRHRRHRRGQSVEVLFADEDSYLLEFLMWAAKTTWRHRSALAPFAVAGALFVAGLWLHLTYPAWWPLVLVLTVVTVAVMVWAPREWAKFWRPLGRNLERGYAAVVTGSAGTWLTTAIALGPLAPLLPLLWIIGTIACAIPWWAHHRRREKVRIDGILEAWPDIAEKCGVVGVELSSMRLGQWGWSGRLRLPRGTILPDLVNALPRIESSLGAKHGAVRIEPSARQANLALIRVIETDPHAAPIPYPLTSDEGVRNESGIISIRDPLPIGVFENADPVAIVVRGRHVLIAGRTGGGKSSIVNDLMTGLVRCRDAVVWGVDLKGGMELFPWRECLSRLATTASEAETLLAIACAEIHARTEKLTAQGKRLWEPTPDDPAIVVLIDEYAELSDAAKEYVDSIARLGRALNVSVVASTQRPTQDVMGNSAVRSQMDIRICTRVNERRQVDLVLDQGAYTAGWRADLLDAEGKFLIRCREYTYPIPARAYYQTDADIKATVRRYRHHRPTYTPTGTGSQPPRATKTAAPIQTLTEAPATSQGPPESLPGNPRAILWRALVNAPPDGISTHDLIEVTGMSRATVHRHLTNLTKTGRATQVKYGHWKATTDTP